MFVSWFAKTVISFGIERALDVGCMPPKFPELLLAMLLYRRSRDQKQCNYERTGAQIVQSRYSDGHDFCNCPTMSVLSISMLVLE